MSKQKQKISNWKKYNRVLVQRGSLTIWVNEHAIKWWHCTTHHGRRGRVFHYSNNAIETLMILKAVFKRPLLALEDFINSRFKLMVAPLRSPNYGSISKRAITVSVN